MAVTDRDRDLLTMLEDGLPLTAAPYRQIGMRLGMDEAEVIGRLTRLQAAGVVKRIGLVVRHHELGYRANAMVVWDVPDSMVAVIGRGLAAESGVTLCYRRERRPPDWPYNLFVMIHGRDRMTVEARIAELRALPGLRARPSAVLFSRRRFKQRGARYGRTAEEAA
jgi:DNA-binding Lrp family transcriptional regulator